MRYNELKTKQVPENEMEKVWKGLRLQCSVEYKHSEQSNESFILRITGGCFRDKS
jgi:hypothetical protein